MHKKTPKSKVLRINGHFDRAPSHVVAQEKVLSCRLDQNLAGKTSTSEVLLKAIFLLLVS